MIRTLCMAALSITMLQIEARAGNDRPPIEVNSPVRPWWLLALPDIDIKFGTNIPGYSCVYGGLCSISLGMVAAPDGDGWGGPTKTETMAVASTSSGEFAIALHESVRHAETLQGGDFIMSGDYTIPRDIASALQISPYTIGKGAYRVVDAGEYIYVVFPRK